MTDELTQIAEEMVALLPLFQDGDNITGKFLATEHQAAFKALAIEAKSLLDEQLGHANDFSMNLISSINAGSGGFAGGPSYLAVEEASKIICAGVRSIQRQRLRPQPSTVNEKMYVDLSRIAALQALSSGHLDYARLVQLCVEINIAAQNECHISTAVLLRTILDHVPPVFGLKTFVEIANNYSGSKSFQASTKRLQGGLRNIADMHLHTPMREKEDLPTGVQVDFAAELDVLLGEVIRLAKLSESRAASATR